MDLLCSVFLVHSAMGWSVVLGCNIPDPTGLFYFFMKVSKGAKIRSEESIQSSTTPDPGYQWESYKLTVRHHKREPRELTY